MRQKLTVEQKELLEKVIETEKESDKFYGELLFKLVKAQMEQFSYSKEEATASIIRALNYINNRNVK